MMLSSEYIQIKICSQTRRNGFDFDDKIWFENRSQPLLIKPGHKGKHRQGRRKLPPVTAPVKVQPGGFWQNPVTFCQTR